MRPQWLAPLIILLTLCIATPVWALETVGAPVSPARENVSPPPKLFALDIYSDGFGLKSSVGPDEPGLQLTLNETGLSAQALQLQIGATYRIPSRFLLWRFYGGGGMEYRALDNSIAPYVLGGSEFIDIFFAEHGFTLEEFSHTFSRAGIRIRF